MLKFPVKRGADQALDVFSASVSKRLYWDRAKFQLSASEQPRAAHMTLIPFLSKRHKYTSFLTCFVHICVVQHSSLASDRSSLVDLKHRTEADRVF
jgi:hypothetical protein